ncbi:hypothetical protein L6164_014724 [Bauhinia variegata]|uniref:Uncharacterized protein n=1 Tax=Bauhinia variegata TaxID=167791 RepID=A0ACB9NJP9_BAUVA|nr:hypothetical protein L6164_014724 [Bauhinia variegata]
MESTAFTLSSSLPLQRLCKPGASLRFDPIRLSASSSKPNESINIISSTSFARRSWCLSPSSSVKFRPFSAIPPSNPSVNSLEAGATSVPESADESSGSLCKTVELGVLFGLWYLFNIYFNIYKKKVLKMYHFSINITLLQSHFGSVLALLMRGLNPYKRPKIGGAQLAARLPLAVAHLLGNLFTNMSLGKVSVSFTHTIKATEPFFSVILSAMFLRELPIGWVVTSLVPIVGGVVLVSATVASFNWAGFWSAMASNLTNQSHNVLSKKLMVKKEESMDNITLFSIITVMSFLLLAPAVLFMDGVKFTPAYLQPAGLNLRQVYTRSLLAALCFHAYQQVSNMILQRVSPVTHSECNCVKWVVVIGLVWLLLGFSSIQE